MSPARGRAPDLVRRSTLRLTPDPSRTVSQLFVAGEEVSSGSSRVSTVVGRVLALPEEQVEVELAEVRRRFEPRHEHLTAVLLAHFDQVAARTPDPGELSPARRMLLGAYATSEYTVEAAALCNPSMVAHPDQSGVGAGELRFVLSLRAIGEGHISSIEFRTGVVDAGGGVTVQDPGRSAVAGRVSPGPYDRAAFGALLRPPWVDGEVATAVLGRLGATFTRTELDASVDSVGSRVRSRRSGRAMLERIHAAADGNYTVSFPPDTRLDQRVLRPSGPAESRGMEDARFVRFVGDDGTVTWYATYTAFDGSEVSPQLLSTEDFRTFSVSQLTGRAAANKGMALFPRRIAGRYVALSRWNREANAVTFSADGRVWDDGTEIQAPVRPWEIVQVGNCGSPIETGEGWLVITHGVGPVRTYRLGALLLDLADPTVVRGRLAEPLLEPVGSEGDGYVPNVVYSCGALLHNGLVVLPYATGDRETTVATVGLDALLERLLADGPGPGR